MSLADRLSRLEAGSAPCRADRWRADMERARQGIAEARRKLAALIKQKLAERSIGRDHLPLWTAAE